MKGPCLYKTAVSGLFSICLMAMSFSALADAPSNAPEAQTTAEDSPQTDAAPETPLSLNRPNHRFFNVRLTAGADMALGDALSSRGLGDIGGQGAIGIDWVVVEPLAFSILIGYSAFASGDDGALQDLFATVGFMLRLFPDKKGALGQPGGNIAGHLFLDAHFGYHSYENHERAGYNVGLGYEFSLAKDFNFGPFVRFAHTPIGNGFSYFSLAFGIQASVGGKFKPDDADQDGIEDDDDKCPLKAEDKDVFEDEDGCPDLDNDQDGVPDEMDECPDVEGVESNKGCAETDNDHDTILNDEDECPDEAEDMDGFEDEDGCPDADNDQDGLADGDDKCPLRAEDNDYFEDEDGCPDLDNDKDNIPDAKDKCPEVPETVNEKDDTDGCPDYVRLGSNRIVLLETVAFNKAGTAVLESAKPMLQEVAAIMALLPDLKIRVEGHTDNRLGKKAAAKLATKRAETVKAFLVEAGVAEARLEVSGVGSEKPIADNKTKAGREKNDRIELVIVRQPSDAAAEQSTTTPPAPAPKTESKAKKTTDAKASTSTSTSTSASASSDQ